MFRRKYTRIHMYIDCIQSIGVHTFTEMCTYMGIHIHNYLHLSPMGWLRLVGSLKLYAFFAREPYKGTSILQKRPTMLRSLPIVATPYTDIYIYTHVQMCVYVTALIHTQRRKVWRQECGGNRK